MALDAYKNFAKGTPSTGYDAAATSIVMTTGDSAKFPAVPFNFTWWNATDYADPSDDPNVEIARCTVVATETWTVTRAQDGTSAATHNTGGKTYKIIAPLTAKGLNTDLYTLIAGAALLPNAKVKQATGSNLATGDSDLYTVPTGKRAWVSAVSVHNPSAGTIVVHSQVKISGTYYRLSSDLSRSTGTSFTFDGGGLVLEAADIFSVNTTTTAGLNVWATIVEFDNTSGVKSPRLAGLSTGHNTLYTVATGKTAMLLEHNILLASGGGGTNKILAVADAGGTRTFTPYYVPSGGSAGTTNQAAAATGVSASSKGSISAANAALGAADFIDINVDTGNAAQFVWANVVEI